MPFFSRLVASILVLIGTPVLISHPMGNLSISRYARLDLSPGEITLTYLKEYMRYENYSPDDGPTRYGGI